jgi:serine/threonine protein kinase
VLEYVEDGDLVTLLQTVGGGFLFEVARKYFTEMVLTLEYMHNLGLTHGDIKLDK